MSDWAHQARKYLQFERVEENRAHVQQLLDGHKDNELKRLFAQRLTFGTAGIRGRMGPGYGQMNDLVIIQTSQGLARYLLECYGEKLCQERGVIIGHDARHNSQRFSRLAALAFLQLGIPVYYCDQIIPTPLVAYGVNLFTCLCGIVVTASHNPKEDNGYKVYWANGAQILSPHDKNIQQHIEHHENQRPWAHAWRYEWLAAATDKPTAAATTAVVEKPEPMPREFEGLLHQIHGVLTKSYFAYIQQLVGDHHQQQNQTCGLRLTYTTMHGVGHAYLSRALKLAGFRETRPVEAQREPDPEFPTVRFPNPEEAGALDLAFETAARTKSTLILANDPDADRCAAALYEPQTGRKRVLTGNEIGALLGWWIWHCHQASLAKSKPHNSTSSPSLVGGGSGNAASDSSSEDDDTAIRPGGATSTAAAAATTGFDVGVAGKPRPVSRKPRDCYMLSTAVSSRFLRSMAAVEGFRFVETLTGFKYMGNVAHNLIHARGKTVLFAYEEAIGYMVDSQILDKDGISAAVQLAQCAAHLRTEHQRTLEDQLDWLHLRYGYHYSLNSYYICRDPRTIKLIFHHLQTDYPKYFSSSPERPEEFEVTRIRDLNNGIDNGQPDHRATLPTSSSSFMVTFFIGTEIQFTIRTSGTEPKIKYYSEIVSQLPASETEINGGGGGGVSESLEEAQERTKREARARLKRFVSSAIERCLRPAHYNLEAAAGSQ